MRAMVMHSFGSEEVLELSDVQAPEPGPGEALVRVGAVEVSGTRDVATRTGKHPFSRQVALPHVLGGDFAGVVEAVGGGVEPGLVGRRVAASCTVCCGECVPCSAGREAQCLRLAMVGIHRWGSYADLAAVPAANLNLIPDELGMAQAAALAANGPIAFTQLEHGRVEEGTWVLVTGATGALGTVLLALAGSRGARVVGLSRRPGEIEPSLAPDGRLDANDDGLGAALLELTGEAGIEAVVDNVAQPAVFARYFPALAAGGRVVVSGAIGTPELPVLAIPAAPFYLRSLSLLGVRTTSARDARRFWELVGRGFRLPDGLVQEHPLEAAGTAHALVASGAGNAHTVLAVQP